MRKSEQEIQEEFSNAWANHVGAGIRKDNPDVPEDATTQELIQADFMTAAQEFPDLTEDEYFTAVSDKYKFDDFKKSWKPVETRTWDEKGWDKLNEENTQTGLLLAQGIVPQVALTEAVRLGRMTAGKAGPLAQAAAALPGLIGIGQKFVTGAELEKAAGSLPAPNIAELRARGYSEQQIRNIVSGYAATQQSIMGDVEQTGREGLREAAETMGMSAFGLLPGSSFRNIPGAVAARNLTGSIAGRSTGESGAARLARAFTGGSNLAASTVGGAVTGAKFGAAYLGSVSAVERGTQAVADNKSTGEVLKEMSEGLLSGAKQGAMGGALIGGPLGLVGGAIGNVVASRNAKRNAVDLAAKHNARIVSLDNFTNNFEGSWLQQRYRSILEASQQPGAAVTDEQIAAALVREEFPDIFTSDEAKKAVLAIAEKIKSYRARGGNMEPFPLMEGLEPSRPFAGFNPPQVIEPNQRLEPFTSDEALARSGVEATPVGPTGAPPVGTMPVTPRLDQPPVPPQTITPEGIAPEGAVREVGVPPSMTQPLGAVPGGTPEFAARDLGPSPVTPREPGMMAPEALRLPGGPQAVTEGMAPAIEPSPLQLPQGPAQPSPLVAPRAGETMGPARPMPVSPEAPLPIERAPEPFAREGFAPDEPASVQLPEPRAEFETTPTFTPPTRLPKMLLDIEGLRLTDDRFPAKPGAAATEAVRALGKPVFEGSQSYDINGVQVEVLPTDDGTGMRLLTLASSKPGEGRATSVLKQIVEAAKARNSRVEVTAIPYDTGKGTIPYEKLRDWYAANGFKVKDEGRGWADMVYEPTPVEKQLLPEKMAADANAAVAEGATPVAQEVKNPPAPGPGKTHPVEAVADASIAAAKERMNKRLRKRGGVNVHFMGYIDPRDLIDATIIGYNYMLKGAVKSADWTSAMLKEFGDGVKPHLKNLYAEARAMYLQRRTQGNDVIRSLRADYQAISGLARGPRIGYQQVDVNRARRIAAAYEALPTDAINGKVSPEVRAATKQSYDMLIAEIKQQYEYAQANGFKFEFVDNDPYKSSADMLRDVRDNNRLKVLKTPEGFNHPYLTNEQNDMLRAVHDLFGHAAEGVQFGSRGEDAAFMSHASMFSTKAIPALATETRGQNSWVNYSKGHEALPVNERPFATQKAALLPEWAYADAINRRNYESRGLGVGSQKGDWALRDAIKFFSKGVRKAIKPETQRARFKAEVLSGYAEQYAKDPQAADWYHADIAKTERMLIERIPELADPNEMSVFKLLLAVTSQQTNVRENMASSLAIYRRYQQSGQIPLLRPSGKELNVSSRAWVKTLNELLADPARRGNLAEWLQTINRLGRPNAVDLLGPKIGRFYLNLAGVHAETTVDVWMARIHRRINGTLADNVDPKGGADLAPSAVEGNMMREVVKEVSEETGVPESAIQALMWVREKEIWGANGFPSDNVTFSQALDLATKESQARLSGQEETLARMFGDRTFNLQGSAAKIAKSGDVNTFQQLIEGVSRGDEKVTLTIGGKKTDISLKAAEEALSQLQMLSQVTRRARRMSEGVPRDLRRENWRQTGFGTPYAEAVRRGTPEDLQALMETTEVLYGVPSVDAPNAMVLYTSAEAATAANPGKVVLEHLVPRSSILVDLSAVAPEAGGLFSASEVIVRGPDAISIWPRGGGSKWTGD